MPATPVELIPKKVTSFDLDDPRIFWLNTGYCPDQDVEVSPRLAHDNHEDVVSISRIASYGGLHHELLEIHEEHDDKECSSYKAFSNIISDGEYVWWVGSNGLVRLPYLSNVGDRPESAVPKIRSRDNKRVLLVDAGDFIFSIMPDEKDDDLLSVGVTWKEYLNYSWIYSGEEVGRLSCDGKRTFWVGDKDLWMAWQTDSGSFARERITGPVTLSIGNVKGFENSSGSSYENFLPAAFGSG